MAHNVPWGKREPIGPPPRALWREPARFAIGVGCLLIAATALQPWATGSTPIDGPVSFGGWSGAGDGVIILALAGVTTLTALVRSVVEATSAPVRWVPLVCAVAMAFEFGTAVRTTGFAIDDWVASNGSGTRTGFLDLLGLGIGFVLIGAVGLVSATVLRQIRLRR